MAAVSTVLEPEAHRQKIETGLDASYREEMAGRLSDILASTYQLTIKSHVYHWNVVGPLFRSLHELTEEHYNALFAATDIIAERIRALGHLAPVAFSQARNFAPAGKDVDHLSAIEMVTDLVSTHEEAVRNMREAAARAGDADDVVTEDMLTQRLNFHEKALWMLRAIVTD